MRRQIVSVLSVEEFSQAIELEDAVSYCRDRLKIVSPQEALLGLIEIGILPIFPSNGRRQLLLCDLEMLEPILKNWHASCGSDQLGATLFTPGRPSRIPLGKGDCVELASDASINPACYPGI